MQSSIPQEVLQIIIDLVQADRKTLTNLGQVARCFVPRTRVHLFRQIRFNKLFQRPNRQALLFLEVLNARPFLSRAVKHITLSFFSDILGHHEESIAPLIEILHRLSCVSHLRLEWIDWSLLPVAGQTVLANMMASPQFLRLELIKSTNLILGPIVQSRVKELEVSDSLLLLDTASQHVSVSQAHTRNEGLTRLHITNCGHLLQTLLTWDQNPQTSLRLSKLADLTVDTHLHEGAMENACAALFQHCSSSLRKVRVEHSFRQGYRPLPTRFSILSLSQIPQLEEFELTLLLDQPSMSVALPYQAICRELAAITRKRHPSPMKRLVFSHSICSSAKITGKELAQYMVRVVKQDIWLNFSDILANDVFPVLREFTIAFAANPSLPSDSAGLWDDARWILQQAFTLLLSRGVTVHLQVT